MHSRSAAILIEPRSALSSIRSQECGRHATNCFVKLPVALNQSARHQSTRLSYLSSSHCSGALNLFPRPSFLTTRLALNFYNRLVNALSESEGIAFTW